MNIPKFLGSSTAGHTPTGGKGPGKLGLREIAFNMADGKIFTYDGTKVVELGALGSASRAMQADWFQTISTKPDFIRNKPHITTPDLSKYIMSDSTVVTNADNVTNVISLPQHDYDALQNPDPKTLYLIV